ncbi:hypothetical protein [Arthrobacter sp. Br18]|uniref:hypothetical protein n=1 Tax=Arthrobacter sp. Br18 TaxID=1312954 RepID=UPI0004B9B88A|nr:hypothetical protein [Arthrobacter sp. Br18]
MRTLASAVFALLALVLTAGALSAVWVEENLVQEQGFVALAAPLGDDPRFQAALSDSLAAEVVGSAGLPGRITDVIEPVIADAASSVTGSAAYPSAWNETLRISHAVTFAGVPAGTGDAAPAALSLDLGPVARLVADTAASSLGIDVPVPSDTTVDIGSFERGGLVRIVADAAGNWPLIAGAAGICALLAVLIARRRGTTIALLGCGVALIGLAGWFAASLVPGAAVAAAGQNGVAQVFAEGLAGRVALDLAESSLPVLVAGGIAVVIGGALRLTLERSTRS